MLLISRIIFTSLILYAPFSLAYAAQNGPGKSGPAAVIGVHTDRSRFLDMPPGTRTVAVGNPAIADALIVGDSVVLTGKSPGSTNLLAADERGQLLLNAEITVTPPESGVVRVYRGVTRNTLHCAPLCEPLRGNGETDSTAQQKSARHPQHSDKKGE